MNKTLTFTAIAAVAAALILAPLPANADDGIDYEGTELVAPPADWTEQTYEEWIWKLDPVACTYTIASWLYERDATFDDESGEIVSFGPWWEPVLESSDFGGTGTLDDCDDWVENEDGSTSYIPPGTASPSPVVEELEPVISPVMKRGING